MLVIGAVVMLLSSEHFSRRRRGTILAHAVLEDKAVCTTISVTRFGNISPLWHIFTFFGAKFKRFI